MVWLKALEKWMNGLRMYPKFSHSVLLIQGDRDRVVDWRYNLKCLKKLLPQHRDILIPGARHHIANENIELREIVFKHLTEHAGDAVASQI